MGVDWGISAANGDKHAHDHEENVEGHPHVEPTIGEGPVVQVLCECWKEHGDHPDAETAKEWAHQIDVWKQQRAKYLTEKPP